MSAPIEIDMQTRQQIAGWAAIFGAIAAMILASGGDGDQGINPLLAGFIGFVLSFVVSLLNRGLGVGIIFISSIMILHSCHAS